MKCSFIFLALVILSSASCSKAKVGACQKISNFQYANIPDCHFSINNNEYIINKNGQVQTLHADSYPHPQYLIVGDIELTRNLKLLNLKQAMFIPMIKSNIKQAYSTITNDISIKPQRKILILNQNILFQSFLGPVNSIDVCPLRQLLMFKLINPLHLIFSDEKEKYKFLFSSNIEVIWLGELNFEDYLSFHSGCEWLSYLTSKEKYSLNEIKDYLNSTEHPLSKAKFKKNIDEIF